MVTGNAHRNPLQGNDVINFTFPLEEYFSSLPPLVFILEHSLEFNGEKLLEWGREFGELFLKENRRNVLQKKIFISSFYFRNKFLIFNPCVF